jgi:4'-phosphopantetheinyl transferase
MDTTAYQAGHWNSWMGESALDHRAVHVWLVNLDVAAEYLNQFNRLLDRQELDRAHRFYFDRDRVAFVARRGVLRNILARYLKIQPGSIVYNESEYGKLSVVDQGAGKELYFNLSRSGNFALVAVNRMTEVGVDIEKIVSERADRGVAGRFFTRQEYKNLEALGRDKWDPGFFSCWTRKEAFIKAVGEGLSRPLDSFEVSVNPGAPPRLLKIDDSSTSRNSWSMAELPVVEGYQSALAIERPDIELKCWKWTWIHQGSESLG